MPKKKSRRRAAPKRVRRCYNLTRTTNGKDSTIHASILGKLAGLAAVSNDEVFCSCITFAVRTAHKDFPRLSRPVYAGQFIERVEEVKRAALLLRKLMDALQNPRDRTAILVGRVLTSELFTKSKTNGGWKKKTWDEPLTSYVGHLSILAEAAENAKNSPWVDELEERGRPSGVGGTGQALGKFISLLEYGASASGGRWTLNKNDERGTLIDALELLRAFLPDNFLPPKGKHPYSSYQAILTRARSDWKKNKKNISFFIRLIVAGYAERSSLTAREMHEVRSVVLDGPGHEQETEAED
jgi:hypothetical protein